MGDRLNLVPCSIRDATAFIEQHHRHHEPPQGAIFALAAALDGKIVAVATVGRPVSRHLQSDGWTVELTRLASDGTPNACSFLYGRAWRAARAMGWRRMITYTRLEENGASLRAAGWRVAEEGSGGTWSRPTRPRVDKHPLQGKLRWEVAA